MRRSQLWWLFAAALLVRLAGLALTYPDRDWKTPGITLGAEMGRIAANLAEGRGYSSPFEDGTSPTTWFAPAVPLLWAALFKICGVFSASSLLLVLLLQVLANAATCVLYALLVDRLWRRSGGRPGAAPWIIAAAIALWPQALLLLNKPWYFPFQELGTAALLVLGMRWVDAPRRSGAIAIGVAAGIVGLINPVPLIAMPWLFAAGLALHRQEWRRVIGDAVLAGALCLLTLLPWAVRNQQSLGVRIWTRGNFGVELLQGNNRDGAIVQTRQSLHPMTRPEERQRYHELGEVAYSREARQRAVDYMQSHVATTATRTALRVYAYWCGDLLGQWTWEPAARWWRRSEKEVAKNLLRHGLTLLPLLGLLYVLATGRWRRVRSLWLFAAIFLCLPAPYYLTHVNVHYAYAVRPYLILFVGLALGLSWRERAAGHKGSTPP